MKYCKNDILQMLVSQYQFAIEFDPVVVKGMDFTHKTSIVKKYQRLYNRKSDNPRRKAIRFSSIKMRLHLPYFPSPIKY